MNLRITYIDNCKLKKTRNRLIRCSVKINEIDKKNLHLQLIMSIFIKDLLYINIGNNCCTQYFYYSIYCVDT